MGEPKIIVENWEGKHNTNERYKKYQEMGLYRNLATVWITPTRGKTLTKIAFNWMNVTGGFNQGLVKLCVECMEVGAAYNIAIKEILANPALKNYQYLFTVEEDNTLPPDTLLKLYESIQEYDGVSGLYWLKGPDGPPQIWGDPKTQDNFVPQTPIPDTIQRCNGIGMGCALWRLDMFKNAGFEYGNWFVTGNGMTQDLYFCKNAIKLGYKFAVDTRVKVGHVDMESGEIW